MANGPAEKVRPALVGQYNMSICGIVYSPRFSRYSAEIVNQYQGVSLTQIESLMVTEHQTADPTLSCG